MATEPPRDRRDDQDDDRIEEPGLQFRELDDLAFQTPDGAYDYSDEPPDPAMQPVIEAGGGVAEGFEQAEAELIDNASEGPPDGTQRLFDDVGEAEAEADPGVYGDADHESSSEDDTDE